MSKLKRTKFTTGTRLPVAKQSPRRSSSRRGQRQWWQNASSFFDSLRAAAVAAGRDPEAEAAYDELERVLAQLPLDPRHRTILRQMRKRATADYADLQTQLWVWAARDAFAVSAHSASSPSEERRVRRAFNWYMFGRPTANEGGRGRHYPPRMIVSDYRKMLNGELLPWCKDGPLAPEDAIGILKSLYAFQSWKSCLQFLRREWRNLPKMERFPLPGNPTD